MTSPSRNATRGLRTLVAASILGVAACTSAASASPSTVSEPSASASLAPSASAVAAESQEAQATAVPTSVDPCQLVTAKEVSALTGATFSADAGQAATDTNNVKTCSYGQEGVDVTVLASRAPDVATAKKDEDDAKADLQKNAPGLPIKVDDLPGFSPGADAVVVSLSMGGSASTYSGIAIYVLKGTDFFAITDISTLGSGGPTSAQMQDLAKVALGRLP